jgi:two-component system cell cycle sensor histidine kinase/response regulator CckA
MQALGQLAGGIAHDFNNLLTVISGHVEMLLTGSPGEEVCDSLAAVRDAARRAAALTEQMLAFSRRRTSRIETIDLNDLLRKLMGILSRLIREDIDLTLIASEAPAPVTADPHEIERVVLNLAVNAQDAMPEGGTLTIECSGDQHFEISVRDTGTGMDRMTQAHIFEPFFTTKGPGKGTGLGLSVVYGIVRRIGGHIRLESEPGEGTTFRIFLPRADGMPLSRQAPLTLKPSLPRGSETVLFAEDDPTIRELLTPFLEGLGYRVLSAPDGLEAWRVSQVFPDRIHLLLSDVVMPGLGGRELLSRIRDTNRADLKVLFISGYTGDRDSAPTNGTTQDYEEGRVSGVRFLQKPFSLDLLATVVREVLDASAITRSAG